MAPTPAGPIFGAVPADSQETFAPGTANTLTFGVFHP